MAKNDDYQLDGQDALDILASALEAVREHARVGIRNAPAKNGRRAGVMIFVEDAIMQENGLEYVVPQKEAG